MGVRTEISTHRNKHMKIQKTHLHIHSAVKIHTESRESIYPRVINSHKDISSLKQILQYATYKCDVET